MKGAVLLVSVLAILLTAPSAQGADASWFLHPAKHFRILVPPGWTAIGNVTMDGQVADLAMTAHAFNASLFVISQIRRVSGFQEEARTILQEAIVNISSYPDFRFLGPTTDLTIDQHPAASVFVTWRAPNYTVDEIVTVIVAGEWHMFWGILGTTHAVEVAAAAPVMNATVLTFEVLPWSPPASPTPPADPFWTWLVVGAAVGLSAAGGVLAVLFVRYRKRLLR